MCVPKYLRFVRLEPRSSKSRRFNEKFLWRWAEFMSDTIIVLRRCKKGWANKLYYLRRSVIRWEETKVTSRCAFGCIIQTINQRILPSRVYQRCGPKNRDSLRAQRPVQSVLSSERARAHSLGSPLHNKSLQASPLLFCPFLSPHFLPVSFAPVPLPSGLSLALSFSPCCGISRSVMLAAGCALLASALASLRTEGCLRRGNGRRQWLLGRP